MGVVVKPRFYSLFIVCFAVYCVSCDSSSSSSSSSFEDRTLPAEESYEQTDDRSLRYDDDGSDSFEAKRVGNRAGIDGHATEDHQVKRFLVPFSLTAAGLDMSGNRPSMFMHQQQQQHQQPRYQNHKQQQQQQQQQQHHHNQQQQHQRQHPPPQQQHSNLQHHRQQQQQHHRQQQQQQQQQQQKQQQGQMSAGVDHNDFGPSDSGESGGFDDPSSDGFYQQGGSSGGEALNFETTGFADFVPSTGYHSPGTPTMPAPPSFSQFSASPPSLLTSSPFSVGPSQLQSSPFGDGNGGGSSGQLLDTAGFDQKSALMSVGGGGRGADVGSAGYNYASQSPVVHKSVYVHVAPPDDDEPPRKQRVIVPNVPPKKNYQIVFIKAPTAPPLVAPIIPPPPPQHSDKTLIYVLHPKQEDAPPIHIPPPPETPPLKPEVYFIKYKNRGEEPSTGGDGDEYGSDHGGGVLSSPADEFNDVSDGYPHRRYGRGDKTHEPSATSPSVLTTAVGRDDDVRGGGGEDEDGVTSSEQRERVAAVDREHEDFETTASDPTTKATVRSSVDDELLQHRDGYSGEYNDASVDSSNVNEMHVQQQQSVPIVAPKGKNGH